MAAWQGFAKVIGVEFCPELAAIAKRNCLIVGFPNIEVITADACDFTPPSGNLLVYMYNPFELPVMRRALANLLASAVPTYPGRPFEQCSSPGTRRTPAGQFGESSWNGTSRGREAGELYIVYLTPRCARLFDAERRFRKVFRAPSLAVWSLSGNVTGSVLT
jgi:hypothetical protein